MGMFKEEAYIFEELARNQPYHGFNSTSNLDEKNLQTLRDWMNDMASLRIQKYRKDDKAIDIFFIAWEMEGGRYLGTEYIVTTEKVKDRKFIALNCVRANHPANVYDNYRG